MRFELTARTGHPDFLDLPWSEPLSDWQHDRVVEIPLGVHRHVVRVVEYDEGLYVLKELPRRYADREYRFLRYLREEEVPAVDVVGVVRGRTASADDEPLEAVLITRHLEFSLPYRHLFQRRDAAELRDPMLDALVGLLVQIHLVGFMWGDCSMSNTLFRRDAGRLAAYVVDTETGELHDELTDGQRRHDVEIAIERCAGELFDLAAAGLVPPGVDPVELGEDLRSRYTDLWDELTRDEVFGPDERFRLHERLERINELGFDVEEIQLEGDDQAVRLHLSPDVVEPGRPRRRLRQLTGLDVQDNQARRLLNDMESFRAWLQHEEGRELPDRVVAARWLDQSFEPTVAAVPDELRGKREPAEIFHEVLEHWYFMSDVEGQDMDLPAATRSYIEQVLREVPDEVVVLDDAGESEDGEE
ncbi:MAG: DUF4032 domain-containing protein [Nitriliruptorales bacterium]|nr:DUF4032 domain-containing protein [Nitriliruptorales bacterium]